MFTVGVECHEEEDIPERVNVCDLQWLLIISDSMQELHVVFEGNLSGLPVGR
jgi:hypothetical protein